MPRLDSLDSYEVGALGELRVCWYVTLVRLRWRISRRISGMRRRLESIQSQRDAADQIVDPGFKLRRTETIPPELRDEWAELQDELVLCDWYRRMVEDEMAQRPIWMTVAVVASILGATLAALLAWTSGGK
jgi:hypothetical protein